MTKKVPYVQHQNVQAQLDATPFQPPWWLRNPHLQTIAAKYSRHVSSSQTSLQRWATPDNDFLRVHFLPEKSDMPTVLLVHGLEGSRQSIYIVGLLREIERLGWNGVVFEHRSCGGEMNRAKRLYHSGEVTDLDFVVQTLCAQTPNKPLFIVGYSLGANQVAKWLGTAGNSIPNNVAAAAVISAPFDLARSARFMDTGIRRYYVKHFLQKLIPKAIHKEAQYPGCLDIEKIKRANTFRQFDDHATAPLHGFIDADDYYTSVACGQFLSGIKRPTLLLSAMDDPFNPGDTLPYAEVKASPYLTSCFPKWGGHVGFISAGKGRGVAQTHWADAQILRFFQYYQQ